MNTARFRGVPFAVLTVLLGVSLNGCVSTADKVQNQTVEPAVSFKYPAYGAEFHERAAAQQSALDATTMFEILAAEMLVQKQQYQQAYELIYPLAKAKSDAGLAKRAFEVSMATYDENSIKQAAQLWKTVAPEEPKAWRAAFQMSLRDGLIEQALQEWHEYHKLSENRLQESLMIAANKVSGSVPEAAGLAFFQRLVAQYPKQWAAHFSLAMVASTYQQVGVGLQALDKAQQLMPEAERQESESIVYNLMSKFYLLSDDPQTGIKKLTAYLKDNPANLLIQERLARLQVRAGLYDEAKKRYQSIIEIEPQAWTSRLSLALIELEQDDYIAAEQNLLFLLHNQAYKAVAYYYLGILYQQKKDYLQAKQSFSQVDAAGYYIDAQLHLAEIAFAEDRAEDAYTILNAIELDSDDDKVKILRAKAIFKKAQGHNFEALEFYEQALAITPDNIDMLKAKSLLLYNTQQFEQYETTLLQIIELDNRDSDVLNALGYYYVENRIHLPKAKQLLESALAIAPQSFYILDSLGWYYYQVTDYGNAILYLKKAFQLAKDDEVFLHLVHAYWYSGQVNQAKSLWKKYHQQFSENQRVQNIINELETTGKP
ncbi:tetratricopeptide repeat protein [Thiomicrorhabdus sediminis]|uniref:Uncharacterized protein n=1 Tax=Thiomicrorhabdus sediminis TaxID=2580412 RepID=A0A4V1HHM1_9GAMM|nr:tetratricopeptide repeat protein [Thiomicrorhabdus sediminis]QCU89503.1 hypothetical protein FE785_02045 [Thiomicrorhabdus sediminis]